MHKILLASAAAVLLTGSLANAQFLLGQDENGHKSAVNTYGSARSAAWIAQDGIAMSTSGAGAASPAFLLGQDANGNKAVVNQYSR